MRGSNGSRKLRAKRGRSWRSKKPLRLHSSFTGMPLVTLKNGLRRHYVPRKDTVGCFNHEIATTAAWSRSDVARQMSV